MGTRACRNFRSGAAVVRFVGTRAHPHLVGTLASGSGERAPSIRAWICVLPMFCKCSEFSKWIRDLCVLPERLASAHVYRETAGGVCGVACTLFAHINSVVRISPPPPGRAISFIPVTVCD